MQSTLKKVRIVVFVKDFIDNAQYKVVKGGQLGLSERSLANYKNFQNIIIRYEAHTKRHLHFHALNATVIEQFKRWLLEEQQYSLNHAGRLMGFLKTVCKTAANYGIDTGSCTHLIAGFSRHKRTSTSIPLVLRSMSVLWHLNYFQTGLRMPRNG